MKATKSPHPASKARVFVVERSDLGPATLRKRLQIEDEPKAADRCIPELERENRGLRRRVDRAELIGEIEKLRGSWR